VNLDQSSFNDAETKRQARNTVLFSSITAFAWGIAAIYIMLNDFSSRVWPILPIFLASILAIWLSRTGRHTIGRIVLICAVMIQMIIIPLIESGVSVSSGLGAVAMIGTIGLITFPRRYVGRILMVSVFTGVMVILVDLFAPAGRPAADFTEIRWALTLIYFAIFVFLFTREFYTLDIRTKIVLAILGTGGIALVILAIFAFDRSGQAINTLSERLETSVRLLAEEQLVNKVSSEAELANQFFEDIANQAHNLGEYRVAIHSQQNALSQGVYWNAESKLIPLEGGQYGNPAGDVSSVFVPATVELDEAVIKELNTSAYLDFSAPQLLQENPALLAIYYIDNRGVVRYYPNVDLASLLPPDFDATKRSYYEITAPLFNPQRVTRWAIPYIDAAGGGLVVTVAEPVYIRNEFRGVVAADVQLSTITERISSIKVGQTGYAFMIDDAGRIISMPSTGYEMFGINLNELPANEFFKQTILGEGSVELDAITKRMVAGGNGLNIIPVNGIETYITYTRIPSNGYSLAIIVPVSEMQTAITIARNETVLQTRSAIRTAALVLAVLFISAVMVSLAIGQVIASPILRLTQTANQIIDGDLNAQASVASRDEIGTLAQAFNTMTSRLRELLEGLEKRVAERTSELASANEKNERRAKQFESVAQITSTISSTRNMDSLLPEITTVISNQFGFYHVGIFLLDARREYAVLSAANSEGGQRMLARNHQLKVGETGIVGFVTGTGKPRVAQNTGEDAVFFNNPDLPETRSEISLPLRVDAEVVGALDVQSALPNAFDQEDINILTTLADQVSIAIQNARQYEETRKALAEAELLSRQFTQTGWQQFTKSKRLVGIRHTGARATLLYRKNGQKKNETDFNWNRAKAEFNSASLSLPVKLHDEVIGSVDVRAPGNRKWEQDELDIVAAIIERAALAMENARLLAESQKLVAKERTIGEITSKISMQSDINELLKTAAQELGHTLPGAEIAIQFNKDSE
jgi:GAF domain-containing protein/HAMP domain-containing protein